MHNGIKTFINSPSNFHKISFYICNFEHTYVLEKSEFYIQFIYEPHFGTRILLFRPFWPFYLFFKYCSILTKKLINFGFFSRIYTLIKGPTLLKFFKPYVYSFCQIFHTLCLLPSLRLFRTLH